MAIATAFIAFLLVLPAVYAVDYSVGDSGGWSLGMDYATWSFTKTFYIGDTLLFNYGGSHSVDVVTKGDYESCTNGNALESHSDGSTVITLSKAGPMYFICPAMGHCGGGMKLAVTVSAASTLSSNGKAATSPQPHQPPHLCQQPPQLKPLLAPPPQLKPHLAPPPQLKPNLAPPPQLMNPPLAPPPQLKPHLSPTHQVISTTWLGPTEHLASSNLYNVNYMFGACLVLAPLFVLMG